MRRALEVGRRGRFWSGSNPSVGCVLVRDGEVLAEGFTHPEGQDHAEVDALKQVADSARATAYVTLEPCAHTGRTGPCVEALIDAGDKEDIGRFTYFALSGVSQDAAEFAHKNYMDIYDAEVLTGWLARYNN